MDHQPPVYADDKAGLPSSDYTEQVPDNMHQRAVYIDPVVEKGLVRKVDRTLLPLLAVCYLFAFLDRSNIGNAQTAGMSLDLGLNDGQYQWLLTIFYIPYILFEWGALLWKIYPPHIVGAITVFTWGLSATLQSVAFNWAGLMVCRWFLAMNEAVFGPSIPYLLSFFYRRGEIGFRCGIFLSAAPLANCFAGALAYGITHGHAAIANWRLLFLVEGIPSMIAAGFVFFLLPDSADKLRFLTPQEKEVALARSVAQTGQENKARIGKISLREILESLRQPQTIIQALMYFSCNVSFASLPVFLPTILTGMGFTSINAQGLTAPPYFISFLVCIGSTYLADKIQQRGLIIFGLSLMAGAGYIMLAVSDSTGVRYAAVFLAAGGVFPSIANILGWSLNNQGSDTKRGVGIVMLNVVGQCGPILGTRIFPTTEGPYYKKGMAICSAFMFFNAALAFGLRTYFAWQNRSLAKAEAAMTPPAAGMSELDAKTKDGSNEVRAAASEQSGTMGYRYVL